MPGDSPIGGVGLAHPAPAGLGFEIRPFESRDEKAVVALWERCQLVRAWNDPHKDIRRKLNVRPEWFLVGRLHGDLIASVMAGYDGHRGWLNYLAVDPQYRRRGFARELVNHAERLLRAAGGPKVNLQVRSLNLPVVEFYRQLGYSADDVVSLGKRLESDTPPL
ncbi:MAG: GNAT family acetyltransferase [Thermoplasmata archaeon]|nr:GNAT family acetyltransferase [Thermoplasmata archaeon]